MPISLVSKSPSVVPNTVCKILVSNTNSPKAPNDKLLSTQTNIPVSLDSMPADLNMEDSNVVSGNNYNSLSPFFIPCFIFSLIVLCGLRLLMQRQTRLKWSQWRSWNSLKDSGKDPSSPPVKHLFLTPCSLLIGK